LGVPYEEITFDCAGVNHTAWFTTFRRGDEDLVPRIREVMASKYLSGQASGSESDGLHGGGPERVRTELMRLTGYFHTESSHHASEYWPWFRRTPEEAAGYLEQRWDFYELSAGTSVEDRPAQILAEVAARGLVPSEEYGAQIIDSVVSGQRRVIYGNVPNTGLIDNLPGDACVEVACVVDRLG